ncbi:MAG: HD-GYP domain-containing protein [Aeromonas sp.]
MKTNMRRCALHYIVTLSLFFLYGWQVSPFLEHLPFFELLIPLLITFTLMFTIRYVVMRQPHFIFSYDAGNNLRCFETDLGLYLLGGLLLAGYFALGYNFPLPAQLKILLGMITLGFLVASELSLKIDWDRAHLDAISKHITSNLLPTMSLPRKLTLFTLATQFLLGSVFFLLFNKDMEWLKTAGTHISNLEAQRYVLWEIVFVMTIFFCYLTLIIRGYSRNISFLLHMQTRTMTLVQGGDLDAWVPVTRNDEFGRIADKTNQMIRSLKIRRDELHLTQDVAILGLASLAETRDNETGAHIVRTQHYVKALAEHLSQHHGDIYHLDEATIALLFKSAPLHDVGKVGIPDAILLKPGKLTDEEFAIMKRHPQIG